LNSTVMERKPTCVVHRLSQAEQRVLQCFLAGRLPAGQVDAELARARASVGEPRTTPAGLPLACKPIEIQVPAAA
jgi:hypothetical protein